MSSADFEGSEIELEYQENQIFMVYCLTHSVEKLVEIIRDQTEGWIQNLEILCKRYNIK